MPLADPTEEASLRGRMRVLVLLWVATLFSPIAYATVGLVLSPRLPPQAVPVDLLPTVLGIAAAAAFVGSLVLRYRMTAVLVPRAGPDLPGVVGAYRNALLVAWALAESGAIFGLVLLFLGLGFAVPLGLIVVSGGILLLEGPGSAELENLLDAARRARPGR